MKIKVVRSILGGGLIKAGWVCDIKKKKGKRDVFDFFLSKEGWGCRIDISIPDSIFPAAGVSVEEGLKNLLENMHKHLELELTKAVIAKEAEKKMENDKECKDQATLTLSAENKEDMKEIPNEDKNE
jgi:hypothetical protein